MSDPKIYFHGSYIGNTGYNNHTRDFLRHLSKHAQIKVRNYTIGDTWKGYNETPHDDEPYINDIDKKLLYQQILWNADNTRSDFPIYPSEDKEFKQDVDIVLCETNHHLFYDKYDGPRIAYNVWESTLQPKEFFDQLLEFDEFWVPSKWQKECTIKQGYPEEKIKVVPEGVDITTFFPEETSHPLTKDNRFKFFLAGRWDYRKSVKEIIETFLKTFDQSEPVDLIISVDNPFSNDGLKSTEERLKHYGLEDKRIKVLHFPTRKDYIKIMKSTDVFVSCARSEGWNLPLIEAMACGTVSIYSNCSGQLEFAEGKGLPVNIVKELPVSASSYNHFNTSVGNYYEPDFNHLSIQMRNAFENYLEHKEKALKDSKIIQKDFSWEKVSEIGMQTINDFMNRKPWLNRKIKKNEIHINYINGPRVEVLGDEKKEYLVEFLDGNQIIHSATITNNMWVKCSREYYTDWKIRINGNIVDQFNPKGKRVLIAFDSKSIGDTIGWAPYAVEFAKKHNCKVILSTFHNDWFKNNPEYQDIEFIQPGGSTNCYASYNIGWYKGETGKWDRFDKNPNQVNLIPLQKTATDILGLPYKELNYGLDVKIGNRPIKEKYIVFGPQATAGCKEWPIEYWSLLSNMIKRKKYKVLTLTSNPVHIDGTINHYGKSWDEVATILHHADKFIGLGSGLSWFNWAIEKHTYMINGFAEENHEFTSKLTKISNDICIKCWNDKDHVFDPGDWDWCPIYKGTAKQHICQKSITPSQVYSVIFDEKKEKEFDWGNSSQWYKDTISEEIFVQKIYDKFFTVEEGDVVLDVGASLGPYTFSILDNNPKHVICLEPSFEQFPTLIKNTHHKNVTCINKGIADEDGYVLFESIYGHENKPMNAYSISFNTLVNNFKLDKIDLIKTDSEGGEYVLFNDKNLQWIKENVKKIVGEWHLNTPELKEKFRKFRDTYLKELPNHEIHAVNGTDIKWDLWNEHFIEYYTEIIVYIKNY